MSSVKFLRNHLVELRDLRRILLIRLSSLGDVLLLTPLVNLVRRACPHIEIDVMTRVQYRDLLRCHPAITRLLTFDPEQPLMRNLSNLRAAR